MVMVPQGADGSEDVHAPPFGRYGHVGHTEARCLGSWSKVKRRASATGGVQSAPRSAEETIFRPPSITWDVDPAGSGDLYVSLTVAGLAGPD